jgi:hypothetical protein
MGDSMRLATKRRSPPAVPPSQTMSDASPPLGAVIGCASSTGWPRPNGAFCASIGHGVHVSWSGRECGLDATRGPASASRGSRLRGARMWSVTPRLPRVLCHTQSIPSREYAPRTNVPAAQDLRPGGVGQTAESSALCVSSPLGVTRHLRGVSAARHISARIVGLAPGSPRPSLGTLSAVTGYSGSQRLIAGQRPMSMHTRAARMAVKKRQSGLGLGQVAAGGTGLGEGPPVGGPSYLAPGGIQGCAGGIGKCLPRSGRGHGRRDGESG